jgi:integrase
LGHVRFHDLRHYYASVFISAGCSVKAVQSALGHKNAAETLDIYSHLLPADEDRTRAAVQAALGSTESVTDVSRAPEAVVLEVPHPAV